MCPVHWQRFRACSLRAALQCLAEETMDMISNFIEHIDYLLDTKRKRHIMGGLLLSMSLLFGGAAVTVMTIKEDNTI